MQAISRIRRKREIRCFLEMYLSTGRSNAYDRVGHSGAAFRVRKNDAGASVWMRSPFIVGSLRKRYRFIIDYTHISRSNADSGRTRTSKRITQLHLGYLETFSLTGRQSSRVLSCCSALSSSLPRTLLSTLISRSRSSLDCGRGRARVAAIFSVPFLGKESDMAVYLTVSTCN